MALRAVLCLALLSGALSEVRKVRFWKQGLVDLLQISNATRASAQSRLHCSLLCQASSSCASFAWTPGNCSWAPVVFSNVTSPDSCNSSSSLHYYSYYVIQTQDEHASPQPLGFRHYGALGWLRWDQWVSNHSQALSRCASVTPNLTSLLTLPDSSSLNLSLAALGTHMNHFFFVDGMWNASNRTWTTKSGVKSYPSVTNSTLGLVEDQQCLGLNVTAFNVQLNRVPCNHSASAVCKAGTSMLHQPETTPLSTYTTKAPL